MGASNAWRKSVIRRAFVHRILAALGVGLVPSVRASEVTPPANDRGVPSPPAPPTEFKRYYGRRFKVDKKVMEMVQWSTRQPFDRWLP